MTKTLMARLLVMAAILGSASSVAIAEDTAKSAATTKTETEVKTEKSTEKTETKEKTVVKESSLPKITRPEIQKDLAKLTLVDALDSKFYERSHIKGSLSLPLDSVNKQAAKLLPNKDAQIVVYCMNTKCHAADSVADELAKLGYKNVRIYREGLQDWITAKLEVEGTNPGDPMPPKKTASTK